MKIKIKHSCGCLEEHELSGTAEERDRKVAWFEKKPCKLCWIAEKEKIENARVVILAAEQHLPVLTGTEKQLGWAMRIRQNMIDSFESYAKGCSSPVDMKDLPDLREAFTVHVITATNCNWFIDNRRLELQEALFNQLREWAKGNQEADELEDEEFA